VKYIENEISRLEMGDYVSSSCSDGKVVTVKDGRTIKIKYFPGYVMIEANLIGEIPHIKE
jgi:transcriptional antiterminator NusG